MVVATQAFSVAPFSPLTNHMRLSLRNTKINYSRTRTCLTTISSYSSRRAEKEKKKIKNDSSCKTIIQLEEIHSVVSDSGTDSKCRTSQEKQEQEGQRKNQSSSFSGISSNMWWRNLKAMLGQNFNLEGIISSALVVTRDRHLAIPHISVQDISWIDWVELERRGFRGVIFDKDNTLTPPYSLALWPPLTTSLESCRSVFDENIAIFSNSAGLYQYDIDGSKAAAIEKSLGIRVLRHGAKKPAGTAEEIEKDFGYDSSLLVMVGDRHFTDIVYGNRNGFLTILTKPISLSAEPFIVKQVRKMESFLVNYWCRRGWKPTDHHLLLQAKECVRDPAII